MSAVNLTKGQNCIIGEIVQSSTKYEVINAKMPPPTIPIPLTIMGEYSPSFTNLRNITQPYTAELTAKSMTISGNEINDDEACVERFASISGKNPQKPIESPNHFLGVIFSEK